MVGRVVSTVGDSVPANWAPRSRAQAPRPEFFLIIRDASKSCTREAKQRTADRAPCNSAAPAPGRVLLTVYIS